MKRYLLSAVALTALAVTFGIHAQGIQQADQFTSKEVAPTVEKVALPEIALDKAMTDFVVPVTTTMIDAKNNLVGFQGDFTFDERVVAFQDPVIQKAGITGGNWNVSGNVLPGQGPIRVLRISAFANDFVPLQGSGTLFELRMKRVSKGGETTTLSWKPAPDNFFFIDADLNTQPPRSAAPGNAGPKNGKK
jgi:hypothetical protein